MVTDSYGRPLKEGAWHPLFFESNYKESDHRSDRLVVIGIRRRAPNAMKRLLPEQAASLSNRPKSSMIKVAPACCGGMLIDENSSF